MYYLSVIYTVPPASCHGHFYLLGRPLEKLWEEVGWGGEGDKHTHAKLIQGKNDQRNNGHVNKKIMQLKNFPIPAITFLINGPLLIKATKSAGLHVTTSW